MVRVAGVCLFALLSLSSAKLCAADMDAETAAWHWLAAVDAGDYPSSWKAASSYFREHISLADWVAAVAKIRASLGSLKSRHLMSARFTRKLPGAPDDDYVVIQYAASFDGKANAIETVTPRKDADGNWHVSGYFIK